MAQHTEATTLQRQAEALNWASAATTPEATTLQPLTACQTETLDWASTTQHSEATTLQRQAAALD